MTDYVSIIVPVYNVEKYLDRCMKSLINQTYKNIEILLIDDGSTDNSLELCKKYENVDNRIRVFHKENEGLGLTRNFGINKSTGKYLCFVDSDDYMELDAIEILMSHVGEDLDVVIGNSFYQDKRVNLPLGGGVFDGEEITKQILYRMVGGLPGKGDQLSPSAWGKLYKREMLKSNNLYFPSERKLIWEDLAFNYECISLCKKVFLDERPVYRYCYNKDSLTHKYDEKKINKVIVMYRHMRKKVLYYNNEEIILRLNNNFLGHVRTCLKLEALYDKQNGKCWAMSKIRDICSDCDVLSMVKSVPEASLTAQQRLLSKSIKRQWILIVYILCKIQNMRKKII